MFTTGLWCHRLCRALVNPRVAGAMSRSLGGADPGLGAAAARAVTASPATMGLISVRELAWPMAQLLDDGVRLNRLSLEALAAAAHLDAAICLAAADANPPLVTAAQQRGVQTRLV